MRGQFVASTSLKDFIFSGVIMDFKSRLLPRFEKRSPIGSQKFVRGSRRSSERRKAAVIVETALCLTFVLIPMTVAGIQFAIIINATHTLNRISREGARFAAVHGGESTFDGTDTQSDPPSLRNYVKTLCTGSTIQWSDISSGSRVLVTAANSRFSGQGITVTISYPMSEKMIFKTSTFTDKLGFARLDNTYQARATFMLE